MQGVVFTCDARTGLHAMQNKDKQNTQEYIYLQFIFLKLLQMIITFCTGNTSKAQASNIETFQTFIYPICSFNTYLYI